MTGATSASPRWYRHGWNTTLSLRLILTIVPRLPRWLVPPVAVITTAACIASMRRERRAAASNLRRILGCGGFKLWATQWRLFYNFSRFMVSYCDLVRLTPEELKARVEDGSSANAWVEQALSGGRGVIVLTAHLGNWEVGARLLELAGRPINVVMHTSRANPVERFMLRLRQKGPVRVIRVGTSFEGTLAVLAALERNEIVAMQGDRAFGGRAIELELFGERFAVPIGPFLVAYRCAAPLVPAFVLQRGWSRWSAETAAPVAFPRTGDRDADLRAGARAYARELERVVRAHPDQWFNFFELWDRPTAPRARAGTRSTA